MDLDEPEFPHELAAYCENSSINGLPLLALIARMSILLAKSTTDNPDAHYPVARHYFCYLLAYAVWVGAKHHKLLSRDIALSKRVVAQLPLTLFPKESLSQNIAEFLHCVYRDESFLPLANGYFGPFTTDVPYDTLAKKFQSLPLFVNAICKRYGWNAETFQAALHQTYEPLDFPLYFYDDNPNGREFWNCLLVGVVAEKECNWTPQEAGRKWPINTMLLSGATEEIKMVIVQSSDLHGF